MAADVEVRKEYIDSTSAIEGFRKNAQLFLKGALVNKARKS
jgi:hypothetical protein